MVGVDASAAMLEQALREVPAHADVPLHHGDADDLAGLVIGERFDAVIVTYALSIIPRWQDAWRAALPRTRPDGRAAVVDLALPTGIGRMFEQATVETRAQGHVVLAAGTVPRACGEG